MRLESSIVILKSSEFKAPDIDLVLMVKHPQGIDPVERIHQAIQDFLASDQGKRYLAERNDSTWDELLSWMCPVDWSNHELYVESAMSWAVMEPHTSLVTSQNAFNYAVAEA